MFKILRLSSEQVHLIRDVNKLDIRFALSRLNIMLLCLLRDVSTLCFKLH